MGLPIASKYRGRIGLVLAGLLLVPILVYCGAAGAAGARKGPRHPTPTPTPIALPADITVPSYPAGSMPLKDGERLTFQASWLGIPAASARFELHRDPKSAALWDEEIWLETNPAVDLLYRMRDYLREHVEATSLQPQDMFIRQQENKRHNEFKVVFDRGAGLVRMERRNSRGAISHKEFISANPFGPLSGAVMALSQKLEPGDELVFDVFTGTSRYVFGFHVDGREKLTVPAGTFEALKITPGVKYLSAGEMRNDAQDTQVWVSDDSRHLPLRIQAQAFIGWVRADLVSVETAAQTGPAAAQ
ncbi:MAG TPA: DUF3108 domain-containing protein [Candidatus Binataceae bacterium]|nr:DUF3108 domain-containing protein [Candidatus Binataceae bacterium]